MFAAEDATPVRFEVAAPCTDAPRFSAGVAERTPRIVPAPPSANDADTVEVRVEGTRGSFRIVNAKDGSASAPRTLEGATCDEVVAALGLAVALVFDPDASDKTQAPPAPFTRFPHPPSPSPPPAPSPSPAPPPPAPIVAVGLYGSAAGAKNLPLGVFAFGEVLSKHVSARLAFGFQRVSVDVGSRSASFTWGLLVPDVCPLRFTSAPVELTPCLGMALGVVEAEPEDIVGASSFTRAWVAPKPILRTRLALSPAFSLEAQLAAEIPLVRGEYTFGGVTAYDVKSVIPSFSLGGWLSP